MGGPKAVFKGLPSQPLPGSEIEKVYISIRNLESVCKYRVLRKHFRAFPGPE